MKNQIGIILLITSLSLCFWSCNDDEQTLEESVSEAVKVRFDLGGEFNLIDESPIDGRTEDAFATIYGIAIWKIVDGNTFYETEGVFSDLSKIDYEFYSDEDYQIFFSVVTGGTSQGISYYEDAGDTILSRAFGESRVLNKFSEFTPASNVYNS
ncbi:MAG: hypothetical protein WBA74_17165, partial [Cyclobacteriaceae bacterium]